MAARECSSVKIVQNELRLQGTGASPCRVPGAMQGSKASRSKCSNFLWIGERLRNNFERSCSAVPPSGTTAWRQQQVVQCRTAWASSSVMLCLEPPARPGKSSPMAGGPSSIGGPSSKFAGVHRTVCDSRIDRQLN